MDIWNTTMGRVINWFVPCFNDYQIICFVKFYVRNIVRSEMSKCEHVFVLLITEKAWLMTTRQFHGKIVSTVSISFENRFTILPNGVVSNNSIGQCMMLANNVSCNILAQRMQPMANVNENTKCTNTKWEIEREK